MSSFSFNNATSHSVSQWSIWPDSIMMMIMWKDFFKLKKKKKTRPLPYGGDNNKYKKKLLKRRAVKQ